MRKSKATVTLMTRGKPVSLFCTALLTLLMMTAESMLSIRAVLEITVALFFRHELSQLCIFFFTQKISAM